MWSTFPFCNFLLGSINKPSCSVDMTDYHDLILYKGHCSLKQPSHPLSASSHTSSFQERWEGAVCCVCTWKQPGQVEDLFPWWSPLSFHYSLLCAFIGELWSKGLLCSPGFYRPTRNKLCICKSTHTTWLLRGKFSTLSFLGSRPACECCRIWGHKDRFLGAPLGHQDLGGS